MGDAMRVLLLSAALVAIATAAPVSALAQAGNTAGLVNLPGVAPTETSPVKRLSKPARTWIEAERQRQLAKPGDLVELAFEIETNIGPALLKLAERERIDTHDLIMAIMFEIMNGAKAELQGDLRKLEAARARASLSLEQEAQLTGKQHRHRLLDAKVAEIVKGQSLVSRSLVQNF